MSNIPAVLIPQQSVEMSNVDIHTEILEPINKSQTRLLFNIRKQGILNSGSRLILSVHNANAADDGKSFLSTTCGVASLIDKSILRCGTTILATTEHVSERYMIDKAIHTASMKQNIDMVLDGAVANVGPSPNKDGLLAVDVGSAVYTSANDGAVAARYRPVNSTTKCPLFSIGLDDLFPGLKSLMLPVGYMNQQVSVEILLRQQSNEEVEKTLLFNTNDPASTETFYGLDNCVMHLDYLTYDDKTMNRIRDQVESDKGMPMVYSDMMVTTSQLPGSGAVPSGQVKEVDFVREIGSAGMKVHNVIITEQIKNASNKLTGKYRSDAPTHIPHINFRVNNTIVYPRALRNPILMRNELEKVQGFPMSVHNAQYSYDLENNFYSSDGGSNDGRQNKMFDEDCKFENQDPSDLLAGTHFITCLNLRKGPGGEGTQVANKNILYERKHIFSHRDFESRDIKFFVDYEKSFILRNGLVHTSM